MVATLPWDASPSPDIRGLFPGSSPLQRDAYRSHSPDCKRTVHLHLKNSLCTHCETCCYLEQPLHLSVIPLSLSLFLALRPGVNLSFLLPADSCAWLSGSLFMRSLHLSPAAAPVTPLSSPLYFFPPPREQIIRRGFSFLHWCLFSLRAFP